MTTPEPLSPWEVAGFAALWVAGFIGWGLVWRVFKGGMGMGARRKPARVRGRKGA